MIWPLLASRLKWNWPLLERFRWNLPDIATPPDVYVRIKARRNGGARKGPRQQSALEDWHARSGAQQQHIGGPGGEQAIGDHADDGVDVGFELGRIGDVQVVN